MKSTFKLDWNKGDGLIPAIVQHAKTRAVLMLGFMDKKALEKTLKSKKVWFYSRTKKRLWMKGETSGHTLTLIDIEPDCDNDTLLVQALPKGPTCHTGAATCFKKNGKRFSFGELFEVIEDRKTKMPKDSYTALLFSKGLKKICEKVREESGEVIRAATRETRKRLIEESVDLLYHLLVLLVEKKIALEEVWNEASERRHN